MITVARSWRTFGQQQTIGLLSLYKKIIQDTFPQYWLLLKDLFDYDKELK